MFTIEPKPLNFERSFDIPPGTASAEFVWLAERTRFIVEPPVPFVGLAAAPPGSCDFADYGFEVVDPNGNLVGTDVVDPATETGYMTRTRRVDSPQAGRWTMRATGGEPCVVGGTAPAPQVAMFAVYRNDDVRAEVSLDKATIAANERIRATARLRIDANTYETNIGVTAKLVRGATEVSVPMVDNGTNGDALANDGTYTAFINPSCSSLNLASGGYRFVVELTSDENTALPVLGQDADFLNDVGPDAQAEANPVTATVVAEKLLAVGTCNNPTTACGGTTSTNLCPQETATVNGGPITIAPGTTVPNVSVTVRNCPITSRGVTVGVGPGIKATNVQSSYDELAGTGTVTFDLTAVPSAPTGQHQIGIAFGRTICGTTGATITSCNPVPATLPAATVAVCGTGAAQNVTISRPALAGMCVLSPTITGRVIRSNGVVLNPPRTIPTNGVISLAPGTHIVEWTVVSGGVTRTTQQTIFVVSGTTAGQSFILADRAKVMRNATEFSQVINTGTGITEVGVQAQTGDITSRANVLLRDRSTVHGFLRTSGTLTRQNLTTVTGTIQTGVPLVLGGVSNPPVSFPTMLPASDIVLPPDAIGSAAPGSHRKITANSRAQLTLAAGDYLVEELDIEPQAVVKVSPLTRLFVKNSVIYRGLFANSSGQPAPTFLAYYGTSALFLESNFSGTLLASSARAVLGDADSRTFAGRVLAREIELRPDVTLTCSGGNGLVFDPTADPGGTMLFSASAPFFAEPPSVESSEAEESSGCSVGSRGASERGLVGFALLALVGALRRRRPLRKAGQ
jgi:MYXO-CTERM domain-containing protein